jgi:hypothetical protein
VNIGAVYIFKKMALYINILSSLLLLSLLLQYKYCHGYTLIFFDIFNKAIINTFQHYVNKKKMSLVEKKSEKKKLKMRPAQSKSVL